jgi:hypothetical protein
LKTLIVAQGLEIERILAAIYKHSPNKVIILRSEKDVSNRLTEIIERMIQRLKHQIFSKGVDFPIYPGLTEIDAETHRIDFFDLAEAFADINAIIQEEKKRGNEVVLDISSGNKIVAIAMFLAGQVNSLIITYCVASAYSAEIIGSMLPKEKPVTYQQIASSSDKSLKIPPLPLRLKQVNLDLLNVLEAMGGKANSVTDLIKHWKNKEVPSKAELVSTTRELQICAGYNYVIIRRRPGKREVAIELTEEGRSILSLRGTKL